MRGKEKLKYFNFAEQFQQALDVKRSKEEWLSKTKCIVHVCACVYV